MMILIGIHERVTTLLWYENDISKSLQIKYPIIQAGMAGGVTTPELVAAVSNAKAMGTLGAGYMDAEQMRKSIQKIKHLTDHPFGVNVFFPETPPIIEEKINQANEWLRPFREQLNIDEKPTIDELNHSLFEKQIDIIVEEQVPVCSFTFGVPPKKIIHKLKEENIKVIGTATTVEEAIINETYGMDIVVAQGSEAGGHRGTFMGPAENAMMGTMALIPQIVDHVNIPVIAAGGIMDGRGVLAATLLGAQGVQMGTAFVTSLESGAKDQHKDAIINSTHDQTVVTSAFSGKPARGIQNDFIKHMQQHENEWPAYPLQNTLTKGIRKEAAKQNRPEWMSLWCGQNPQTRQQQSASDIIIDIVNQSDKIMNDVK